MTSNEEMYRQQAKAERIGLEDGTIRKELDDGLKRKKMVNEAKTRLMSKYPKYPGNLHAIEQIMAGTEEGKDFELVFDIDEVEKVAVTSAFMISDAFENVATTMAFAEVIAKLYDALSEEPDTEQGKIVIMALERAFEKRGLKLLFTRIKEGKDGKKEKKETSKRK